MRIRRERKINAMQRKNYAEILDEAKKPHKLRKEEFIRKLKEDITNGNSAEKR